MASFPKPAGRSRTRMLALLGLCLVALATAYALRTGRAPASARSAFASGPAAPLTALRAVRAAAPVRPVECARWKGRAPLPDELGPFVEPGSRALCAAEGDLNRDGLKEFLLVLERAPVRIPGTELDSAQRVLRILVREPGGTLREAARNGQVVYCTSCGGVFGDPFDGVEAGPGTFTVFHYGGSAWRWRADYTFAWAPQARTWHLATFSELSYHTSDPEKMEGPVVRSAPRDFPPLDIATFDPRRFHERYTPR